MPIAKVLLIAEIEIDSADATEAETQRKLDSFRETVLPNDYGISLYRATRTELQVFNLQIPELIRPVLIPE